MQNDLRTCVYDLLHFLRFEYRVYYRDKSFFLAKNKRIWSLVFNFATKNDTIIILQ